MGVTDILSVQLCSMLGGRMRYVQLQRHITGVLPNKVFPISPLTSMCAYVRHLYYSTIGRSLLTVHAQLMLVIAEGERIPVDN